MSVFISQVLSFESVNYGGHYFRHRNGEVWMNEFQDSDLYKQDATWKVQPALNGRSDAISLQSVNYPGHYLRHASGLCRKDPYEDTQLYKDDASWVVKEGLVGKGVSFESTNYENHYIRHQNGRLKKHQYDSSDLYKNDASWIMRDALNGEESKFESGGVEEFQALFKEVTGQLAVLSNDEAFVAHFGFHLKDYLKERRDCAEVLRSCGNHIAKVVHDTGVARTAGGAVGIASGAAILGGLFLAPFTAGASLALTAGGIAGGVGSAATTITASIVKDQNVQADVKEANKILESMKDKDDKMQKFMEELGKKIQRMRLLQKHDKTVADWFKFIAKDVVKGIGYNIIYRGYVVYESVKAARFATATAQFIQADFYAMEGVAIGQAAPGISISGRTLIVAGSTTAKVLSGVFGVAGIGFGIWDIVEGSKDINGSETADEMKKAADKLDEITKHYEELSDKLEKAAE